MPPIQLLLFLASGELHLGRVDDDHEVTRVDERRVDRFVLALEQSGRERGDTTENGAIRVDDVPPAVRALRAGYKLTHE